MKVKRYAERRYLPHIKLTDKNPKITKNMTTNQVEKWAKKVEQTFHKRGRRPMNTFKDCQWLGSCELKDKMPFYTNEIGKKTVWQLCYEVGYV